MVRVNNGNTRRIGRLLRPIGKIPKNRDAFIKQRTATTLFLQEHARQIDSYEQVKNFGDALVFPGEKGLGIIVFLTNGFYQVSKGANILIYNPDFSKKEITLEGNITNINFEYPDKYYYAVPTSRDAICDGDECWFTKQDIIKFNFPLTQDLLERGLYRINDDNFIEHVRDILKNPSKEISLYEKVAVRKSKCYSFGQQGNYNTKNRKK